jgi:hypothetical protein
MNIIDCPGCGEPCGKEYPATHEDPGFREGKGENFSLEEDGTWFCSQRCLDDYIAAVSFEHREDFDPRMRP